MTQTRCEEFAVLTLTENAVAEIKTLVAHPEVPEQGGVRIASAEDGALTLALVGGQAEGDTLVESAGARVFVEPEAGGLVDDKSLDAGLDEQGQVQFVLDEQS